VHVGLPAKRGDGLLERVPDVSAVLKPAPVTGTIVPTAPELGVRVMVGVVVVTRNVAEPKSEASPVTVKV
jgi:hypothetical protein